MNLTALKALGWKVQGKPLWFIAALLRRGDQVTTGLETGPLHIKSDAWELGSFWGAMVLHMANEAEHHRLAVPPALREAFDAGFEEFMAKMPIQLRDRCIQVREQVEAAD